MKKKRSRPSNPSDDEAGEEKKTKTNEEQQPQESSARKAVLPQQQQRQPPEASSSLREQKERLGALELAFILNTAGDDYQPSSTSNNLLRCLRQFTKTVHRDAQQALLRSDTATRRTSDRQNGGDEVSESDNDDPDEDDTSDDSDAEETEELGTHHRPPKEAWKEDTAQYNVPFVGTSVAKGDTGRVMVGEWPTGLVASYLKQSPRAVELLATTSAPSATTRDTAGNSSSKLFFFQSSRWYKGLQKTKKGRRLIISLHRAYLRALAALIMAAIPKNVLQKVMNINKLGRTASEEDGGQSNHDSEAESPRFLPELIKTRLPALFSLLKDEISVKKDPKKSKGGSTVGPLAASLLEILTMLSATSVTMARHVARSLETILPEGTWKRIFQGPSNAIDPAENPDANKESDKAMTERTKQSQHQQQTRTQTMLLTWVLVDHCDSVVFTCISTPGMRDRKIPSGLLYVTLQSGLIDLFEPLGDGTKEPPSGTRNRSSAFYHATTTLLQSLRQILSKKIPPSSRRTWIELFSKDAVHALCKLSIQAHALSSADEMQANTSSVGFQQVLEGSDSYPESLFPSSLHMTLVCEARRLLFLLLGDPDHSPLLQDEKLLRRGQTGHPKQQQPVAVIRALNLLLDSVRGIEVQRFAIYCMARTPLLLPAFFHAASFPDAKRTFVFLQRLRFIQRILVKGPSVSLCLLKARGELIEHKADILESILPTGLKKPYLSKALHSLNPLVVSETLKVLIHAVRRFESFSLQQKTAAGAEADVLAIAFFERMPDLIVILSTTARFDMSSSQAGAFVVGYAIQLVDTIAHALPRALLGWRFDWLKFLPKNAEAFCAAPLFLQRNVLSFLNKMLIYDKVSHIRTS